MSGSNAVIHNSTIHNFNTGYGIYIGTGSYADVSGCLITQEGSNIRTGIGIENRGELDLTDCTISLCNIGIRFYGYDSKGNLDNNSITLNNKGISCDGSQYQYISINNNDITNNVIYNAELLSGGSVVECDFTNNWWGTTDGVEIANKIFDYSDSHNVSFANYLPFYDAPKDSNHNSTSMNYVANHIHSNTTWTQAGGPYVVIGEVLVESGITLSIEAGTLVKCQNDGITVEGTLIANGTSGNEILFTSNHTAPTAGDWSGIKFNSYGTGSELTFCNIKYVSYGVSLEGLTSANAPVLSDLTIEYNTQSGISVSGSNAVIHNSTIHNFNTGYGIYIGTGSYAEVSGCLITQEGSNIRTGIGIENRGELDLTDCTISLCNIGIRFYGYDSKGNLDNNSITLNNKGISCDGSQYQYISINNNDITNNVIYNAELLSGGSVVECDFTNNWWGTTDGVEIANKIFDYSDSHNVSFANYLPFYDAPKDSNHNSTSMNYVANHIHSNTTWTQAGGPYVVIGEVLVESGITLSIEAGTLVKCQNDGITVEGTLIANGTSGNEILFTSNHTAPTAGDWSGIKFNSYGTGSELTFCNIKYVSYGVSLEGLTSANAPVLSDLTIEYNTQSGISVSGSNAVIHNSTIHNFNTGYGIYIGTGSYAEVSGCLITQEGSNIRTGIGIENRGELDLTDCTISLCNIGIRFYGYDSKGNLDNNSITLNNKGISCDGSQYQYISINNNDITNNVIYNAELLSGGSVVECDFTNNWWGTTDGVEIANKIFDYSDSHNVSFANYLPFYDAPKDSNHNSTSMNYVANHIHSNTTWTQAGGPYVVIGEIIIDNLITLSIEAGTELSFSGNFGINVYGQLLVQGSEQNRIELYPINAVSGSWRGIKLYINNISAPSHLEHCKIAYATTGISIENLNSPNASPPIISDLSIQKTTQYGVYINNSEVNIENSIIRNYSGYGIYINGTSSNVALNGCVITQQEASKIRTGTGLYTGSGAISTVYNSNISLNSIGVDIQNNTFHTIQNSIITLNNNGIQTNSTSLGNLSIHNNDIKDNINWNVNLSGNTTSQLSCINNWWGTTDSSGIALKIYDYYDNSNLGKVLFYPFDSSEVAQYSIADINKDGRTDGFDLAILAASFGFEIGDPNYNPETDLDFSGRVDGFDLAILGFHFGEYGLGIFPKILKPQSPDSIVAHIYITAQQSNYNQGDTIVYFIRVENCPPLFAFTSAFNFDQDKMNFAGTEDGGFLSDQGNEQITSLSFIDDGNGFQAITRLGYNDSTLIAGEGTILKVKFVATEGLSVVPTFQLSLMGLIAGDGQSLYGFTYDDLTSVKFTDLTPTDYKLFQNFPNPFNPSTTIRYQIPELGTVSLKIYDILGNEVATLVNKEQPAGSYSISFNGSALASGIYVYRIISNGFIQTRKMLLLK